MIFIETEPKGAHGPEHGRGVRWNDPAFDIGQPERGPIGNQRDAA